MSATNYRNVLNSMGKSL